MSTLTSSQTNRIEYIDIAKGLGMILVVIGHCINGKTFPGTWINSFHMPLFFILSGLCFSEKKYPTFLPFLKKRVKTLLLPCIYFSVLVTSLSTLTHSKFTFHRLIEQTLPGALWFVFILFLAEIVYYFIQQYNKKKIYTFICLFLCLLIGITLNRVGFKLSHSLCSTFTATFYYGLGHILKNNIYQLSLYNKKILFVSLSLCLPGILVLITNQSIDLCGNNIPNPELLYIIVSISGSLGLMILSTLKFNPNIKKIILYIGKNTLVILSLHILFIMLASQYISPIIPNKVLYKILEQIFIWGLLYVCIELINRKVKWILGK